jgi:hypothetical protein
MDNPDMGAFGKFVPGFEFLQNLARQATAGAAPGTQAGLAGMPPLNHWVAPTFDVDELDKRIQDLRAVHFWLDQNTKALSATIQALEVQRMTLATLKGMNMSLAEVAESMKIRPVSEPPPPAPETTPPPAAPSPAIDPMQWWSALNQQFQTIAAGAVKEMTEQAQQAGDRMAPPPGRRKPAAKKSAPRGRKTG